MGIDAVERFVDEQLLRGICYSLTEEEYNEDEIGLNCTMAGYSWQNVSTTPNINQWAFEFVDWRWDPRCVEVHKARHALNLKKPDWDQTELNYLFSLNISNGLVFP